MTKRRDAYKSAFDAGKPGVTAASYDLMLALMLIEKYLLQHDLLQQQASFDHHPERWTLEELLEIAKCAHGNSIDPALDVYRRLQENQEAARLMWEATDDKRWGDRRGALARTLGDHAIISRGFVSAALRVIERRARQRDSQTGGAA